MLCRPGLRQWWQVQEAVIKDGGGVEDTRTLGRFRYLAFGLTAEKWSRVRGSAAGRRYILSVAAW